MSDKAKQREYQARYLEKNREKVKKRAREWWRKKHGSVPRAEYLAAVKAATAEKKKKQAGEGKRKREKKIAPVSLPPAPRPKPSPRPAATARKPGRLLAMAGFVRNW